MSLTREYYSAHWKMADQNEPPNKKLKTGSMFRPLLDWAHNYQAFSVETEIPQIDEEEEAWDEIFPICVIFHNPNNHDTSTFKILNSVGDRVDVQSKLELEDGFNTNLSCNWSSLSSFLERMKYVRPVNNTARQPWNYSCSAVVFKDDDLDDMKWLCSLLVQALRSDFKNGDIKLFMVELCTNILCRLSLDDFFVNQPSPTTATNSVVNRMGYSGTDRPTSPDSSVYSLGRSGSGIVVPDVIVCHRSVPLFVLNIVCKRGTDKMDRAIVQCFNQMLSQIHQQNLHFGIVVTPLQWHLMVLKKTPQEQIQVWQKQEYLYTLRGNEQNHEFNIQSFITMLNWIYRILAFRKLSNR